MAENKTLWQKTKRQSKVSFDKLWGYADKVGAPVNRLSNKLGAEAFWPTTLDKESNKAARILRSFCKDGFYHEEEFQSEEGPKQKQRVIKKIPTDVIRNCKGLAIFTTMRTGLWFSGAGGSGILVARREDGTWSPPTGIMLHTAGLGFLIGVDIYDCVLVLNTEQAVNAFSKWRCTIGGEMSAVAGPVGMGGVLETEVHARQAPIFNYLKSRGFYAGVQIDGTVVVERTDENARYYGYGAEEKVPASDILFGEPRHVPHEELRMLLHTLKAAQGDADVDTSALPDGPPPADYEVVESGHVFGIPDAEDPDPYGVLALEKEGFQLRDASTKKQVSEDEFEFRPSITSPVYHKYNRRSFEGSPSPRNSWRTSTMSDTGRRSSYNIEKKNNYVTADMSTQTDFDSPTADSPTSIIEEPATANNEQHKSIELVDKEEDNSKVDQTKEDINHKDNDTDRADTESLRSVDIDDDKRDSSDAHEDQFRQSKNSAEEGDEEPVVAVVHQAAKPQTIIRPRLVEVSKRAPPALPPRNPVRGRSAGPQASNENLPSAVSGHSSLEPTESPVVETKDQGTGTSIPSSPEKELNSYQSTSSQEERQDSHTSPASSTKAPSIIENKDESTSHMNGHAKTLSIQEASTTDNQSRAAAEDNEIKVEVSHPEPTAVQGDPKSDTPALSTSTDSSTRAADSKDVSTAGSSASTLEAPDSTTKPRVSMTNIRAGLDSDDDDDDDYRSPR